MRKTDILIAGALLALVATASPLRGQEGKVDPTVWMGLADDSTWYVSIMQQAYDYAMVRGRPDQYVIESWIEAPSRSTPESEPWTFTRSVLDFTRKFARQTP
ncbi:hypothetical protein ACFL5Q_00355 [Planctomycetota bacterium]